MRFKRIVERKKKKWMVVGLAYLDVSHAVVVEIGGGGEAFAADGALVGLLAAVNSPVRVERTRR
jgi:hypothetical protein